MKKYWNTVKTISSIGFIVSLLICIFSLYLGITLVIVNLVCISKADKELKKIEQEEKWKEFLKRKMEVKMEVIENEEADK